MELYFYNPNDRLKINIFNMGEYSNTYIHFYCDINHYLTLVLSISNNFNMTKFSGKLNTYIFETEPRKGESPEPKQNGGR